MAKDKPVMSRSVNEKWQSPAWQCPNRESRVRFRKEKKGNIVSWVRFHRIPWPTNSREVNVLCKCAPDNDRPSMEGTASRVLSAQYTAIFSNEGPRKQGRSCTHGVPSRTHKLSDWSAGKTKEGKVDGSAANSVPSSRRLGSCIAT